MLVDDGDGIRIGKLELEVWHTPGHTDGQLSFRLGDLLFSGDNLFRDGCVGAIDAHHGSSIPDFIKSLQRIRASDVEWLLPSHGPVFRKDDGLIDRTIARLETYLHMADFGTCAIDWPLMDEWERELVDGKSAASSGRHRAAATASFANPQGLPRYRPHWASGRRGSAGFSLIPGCNAGRCYYGQPAVISPPATRAGGA